MLFWNLLHGPFQDIQVRTRFLQQKITFLFLIHNGYDLTHKYGSHNNKLNNVYELTYKYLDIITCKIEGGSSCM